MSSEGREVSVAAVVCARAVAYRFGVWIEGVQPHLRSIIQMCIHASERRDAKNQRLGPVAHDTNAPVTYRVTDIPTQPLEHRGMGRSVHQRWRRSSRYRV